MNKRQFRAIDITYASVFVALTAIGANIASFAPFLHFGNVTPTLQPFFAILAGALLGSRLGAFSMLAYMVVGLAGAPVFAEFYSGLSALFTQTGGFIISYIFAAYIVGKIVERKENPTLGTFMVASYIGIIFIYLFSVNYMYLALNTWINTPMSYKALWIFMGGFFIKDVIFTFLGGLIAPRFHALFKKTGFQKK
ncbi:biotin transporter BioY [Priestia filamentosa]|uniref:Biotin transporter n=1 Tax=Priestia endophytica DSM 13796 TaxID=1121089 RepID=A0A1I6AR52_9BACI|nr:MULTISPECIES: biotin transporter BioY [Priestia]KAB2496581.1 biotin transporter BioY [Priestia endophytica]KYG31053.1 BioY family transporter [Priestia endophytica]MBG9811023.1 biotin biosynthesis protein BioC [Priestia endophytica]MBG9813540.1 biotin biosynthesis protein BioC [Priestia endophytica]MCM3536398.1 biotin transporter BioY [Priestia endophytica]